MKILNKLVPNCTPLFPAQAGIQYWVPAFAGTNG